MANHVLEILDGDRAGDVLPVTERTLRIGRKPGNDLVLADEKTSGVHAEIVLEGDRHVLRDLGSTNGTFLDGKRVTELVLTPGDVVTIGRLRVKFRAEGDAANGDAGDLTVRRLDAGRLQRRGGSLGLVVALLIVGLGVGGYLWWQGQRGGADAGGGAKHQKPVLAVTGNKLLPAVAGCEGEDGWNLRAAGSGFQGSAHSHTGQGAFEAVRAEGADAADFAVLSLKDGLQVFAGRTMTIAAHLHTDGGALAGVRAVCFAANEQFPFRFRTGAALQAHDGWQRVEVVVAIPTGCDRLQVEVVAVLPTAEAVAGVDDVAVTEGGQAPAIEQTLAESSQTAIGTGSALAVRSTDADNLGTLLQILPDVVPPALQGLHDAGLCVLSDLGVQLACTAGERSFQVQASGGEGAAIESLQYVFPAAASGGLLVAAADEFLSAAAESEFTARRVLLGDRSTRAMLQFEAPLACRGRLGGGLYRLFVQSPKTELVLGFRSERQTADGLLREARTNQRDGHPGKAADLLRQLARTAPMDSERLAQAQAMRTELLAQQGDMLRQLQQDLDEASFFNTRGGFERVVAGVDKVTALFGENDLEDPAATTALRDAALAQLQKIDQAEQGAQRERLDKLATALASSEQTALAALVQQYVERHLPKPK
ncbi:MAG TPA: FHA domain-containing protein [Planctomycetota bacterium]|nr:FHA domain-containing protein [Planctomycetota bacterium]